MPVEGRDKEVVRVTALKQFASYYQGEVAAFLPETAQTLAARGVGRSASAILTGGTIADAAALMTTLRALNNGGFAITIDGAVLQVGPLNLTAAANPSAVAAMIDAALGSAGNCAWAANKFTISSATSGASSTIGYAAAPASGTNIATTCALTSATGAALIQGA